MNQLLAIGGISLFGFFMLLFSILCFRRTWIKPFGGKIDQAYLPYNLFSQTNLV